MSTKFTVTGKVLSCSFGMGATRKDGTRAPWGFLKVKHGPESYDIQTMEVVGMDSARILAACKPESVVSVDGRISSKKIGTRAVGDKTYGTFAPVLVPEKARIRAGEEWAEIAPVSEAEVVAGSRKGNDFAGQEDYSGY